MQDRWLLVATTFASAFGGRARGASIDGMECGTLRLARPHSSTVRRGGTAKPALHNGRDAFRGDIAVRFADLSSGADVAAAGSRIVGERRGSERRATDDAEPVEEKDTTSGGTTTQPGSTPFLEFTRILRRPKE